VENKCNDNRSNKYKYSHLKIIHTIPQQHTGKAQNEGSTENSHIGHCKLTLERTNVKYKIFNKAYKIISTINCNYRIATTLYTLKSWFISGVCQCPANNNENMMIMLIMMVMMIHM
jgi:hypothetical protein